MTPTEPGPGEGRRTSTGAVIGGIVLGLVGAVIYMVFAFFATYAMSVDGSSWDGLWLLLLVAPAVLGAVLLAFRRTRRAGAGFVMGLAIGMIVVPATCVLPFLGG